MKKDLFQGLSEEQIAKAKACRNVDELLLLAKAERVELTDEQLNAITGGACTTTEEKDNHKKRKFES